MPDVKELGRRVKAKYPEYNDLSDEEVGRRVKAKYPEYNDFTDAPPPEKPPSYLESAKIGIERGYRKHLQPAIGAYKEVTSAALSGNFRPGLENLESFARGTYRALTPPQPQISRDPATGRPVYTGDRPPDQAINELQARREARYRETPEYKHSQQRLAELNAQAALDPSITGKAVRGTSEFITGAAPTLAAAIATRGAVLPTGLAAFAQSAAQPAMIGPNVATGVLPVPAGQAFKAGVNAIRRTFGKGAAQVIEAEALPAATARVRESIGEPPPLSAEVPPVATQPVAELPTVFNKLGTDNIDQIGAMIANANRRFGKKRTPAERQSSMEDYKTLNQLTQDEQRALSQVLPARTVSPVMPDYAGEGPYSREIRDIPMAQPEPQLDANLRELQQFFGGQGGEATAPRIAAEAAPPAISAATPRAASASVTGPSATAPLDALNVAVSDAAATVPPTRMQRINNELLGTLGASKSLRSTADISYPLRQGALLLLRPLQWRQAGNVWKETFRGFKTKNFDAIKDAIETHPLAARMDGAGLYRGTQAAGEEAFAQRAGSKVSELVRKAPIVKQSEQAYTAGADTQRVQAFEQYAKLIDKAGLLPEEALKADKAAAQWINIATGRGSLGKTADKAFELLNFFFFSPRYVASRLNVFNPIMYARNAASPGGRVVLKQQMSDLMQFASVVATTMYLAKQAGADVGLNPNSPDFLKIRAGSWRYDPLAGLQQVMRLIYRTSADIGRAGKYFVGRGEPPKGKDAIDIAKIFLNYKLSPPAAAFKNFIEGRTMDKKRFGPLAAARDLAVPMQWADFVEAYQKEAWGGVLKSAPGLVGVGGQNYESPPVQAAIEKSQPIFTELKRLDKRVAEVSRRKNEPDNIFNARVQQFSSNYTTYGLRLLSDPRFQQASDDVKKRALDALNERAKGITLREFAFPELELDANILMDSAEGSVEREQERIKKRGF